MRTNADANRIHSRIANIARNWRKYGLICFFLLLLLTFTCLSSKFLTINNFSNILMVLTATGCIALGALLVLIIGEFDLSLGYLIGFIMVLGAYLGERGLPPGLVLFFMLVAGTLIGLINGILTVVFRISSFISTLAVGIALSGLSLGLSGGQVLSRGIPAVMLKIGQERLLHIGICVWIFLFMCALVFVLLDYTPYGRSLYAIGGSEKIAFMAGIKTGLLRISAFTIAGLLTGIGAIVQLGQTGAAMPAFGPSLLMPAYAAVFLGVTAYKPGTYNLPGLALALLVLGVGVNGLSLIGTPFWGESLFNGLLLIVAVLTATRETRAVKIG